MSSGRQGLLLAYRWPPGSQQKDLPEVCRELSIPGPDIVHFLIHHGNEGSRVEDPWSPEAGTACAILCLRDLPPPTVDALDAAFAGAALPTRAQNTGHYASAVAWLAAPVLLPLVACQRASCAPPPRAPRRGICPGVEGEGFPGQERPCPTSCTPI